jgi:hypothetical protein
MILTTKVKCKKCRRLFIPDCRNKTRQKYCQKPECRKASKAASQKKWLNKPENINYFRGEVHVKRVQEWREHHPGYFKRKPLRQKDTLQDPLPSQPTGNKCETGSIDQSERPLQDSLLFQPAVLIGLISNLTGLTLQDSIYDAIYHLQKLGLDILNHKPIDEGGRHDSKKTPYTGPGTKGPQGLQLDRSSFGP